MEKQFFSPHLYICSSSIFFGGEEKKASKLVICILMDRPVYGVQFILESKVMAAGLYSLGYKTTLRVVRVSFSLSLFLYTLKFQTNTKMAESPTNMYYPISTRWQVSSTRYRLWTHTPHKHKGDTINSNLL